MTTATQEAVSIFDPAAQQIIDNAMQQAQRKQAEINAAQAQLADAQKTDAEKQARQKKERQAQLAAQQKSLDAGITTLKKSAQTAASASTEFQQAVTDAFATLRSAVDEQSSIRDSASSIKRDALQLLKQHPMADASKLEEIAVILGSVSLDVDYSLIDIHKFKFVQRDKYIAADANEIRSKLSE